MRGALNERVLYDASGPGVLFVKYNPKPFNDPDQPGGFDPRLLILAHIYENGGALVFVHEKDR